MILFDLFKVLDTSIYVDVISNDNVELEGGYPDFLIDEYSDEVLSKDVVIQITTDYEFTDTDPYLKIYIGD